MKSRGIIGRRIVAIEQRRMNTRAEGEGDAKFCWDVKGIVLDNGVVLLPLTVETDHGYYCTELIVNDAGKRKRGAKTAAATT